MSNIALIKDVENPLYCSRIISYVLKTELVVRLSSVITLVESLTAARPIVIHTVDINIDHAIGKGPPSISTDFIRAPTGGVIPYLMIS